MKKNKLFLFLVMGLIFINIGCSLNKADDMAPTIENASAEKIDAEDPNVPRTSSAASDVADATVANATNSEVIVEPSIAEPASASAVVIEAPLPTAPTVNKTNKTNKTKKTKLVVKAAPVLEIQTLPAPIEPTPEAVPVTAPIEVVAAPVTAPIEVVAAPVTAPIEPTPEAAPAAAPEIEDEGLGQNNLMSMAALGVLVALFAYVIMRKKKQKVQDFSADQQEQKDL